MKPKSKYKNKKAIRIISGEPVVMDSLKEARRFDELYVLAKAGKISDLILQPSFILQEGFRDKNGKHHREIKYIADFKYTKDGEVIIEDVKGFKTEIYRIKKKLLLHKHPDINFKEL